MVISGMLVGGLKPVTDPATPTWETMPALMYHSVSAVGGPLRDLAVPPARLAEQLGALTAPATAWSGSPRPSTCWTPAAPTS